MLAQDQSFDLSWRQFEFIGNKRTEARSIQHCAKSINLLPGKAKLLNRQLSENVHRVRYDENVRILPETGRLNAIKDLCEESDVPADQIEPRFIRFATQPGRDEEKVA